MKELCRKTEIPYSAHVTYIWTRALPLILIKLPFQIIRDSFDTKPTTNVRVLAQNYSIFSQHLSSGLLYMQNMRKIMKRNSNLKNNAEKVTYNPSGYQPWVSWAALNRILHTNKAKNCHEDGEGSYCHRATVVAVRHSFQIFEDTNAVVTITLLYP